MFSTRLHRHFPVLCALRPLVKFFSKTAEYGHGKIALPKANELQALAKRLGFTIDGKDLPEYESCMENVLSAFFTLEKMPDHFPSVKYHRSFSLPSPSENKLNAWAVKTKIENNRDQGKLVGKKVVIKDNICIAGVPLLNGSHHMQDYIPEFDATVVTRLLDEGAEIVGKSHCEYLCLSGGSHTNFTGPVHNPLRYGFSAGGSSSGSGALVGSGEVDMAVGGDQGGSIRIPAAYCGVYGMKPTHGLVPYTGAFSIEHTIDSLGPITQSVADNALMLEVIAGPDGLDARCSFDTPRTPQNYTLALQKSIQGMRIGVLREGFEVKGIDQEVVEGVRRAVAELHKLGATVADISVPLHKAGAAIWSGIGIEGAFMQMFQTPTGHAGLHATSMLAHNEKHIKPHSPNWPHTVKLFAIGGMWVRESFKGHFYAKAQNLSRLLASEYDKAFGSFDVLVLPTLPRKASALPTSNSPVEVISRALEMTPNTMAFNVSKHPAMSIPCGLGRSDRLPIGMMIVGPRFGEPAIYTVAHAFEQALDWRTL